jgi:hypothetical protein
LQLKKITKLKVNWINSSHQYDINIFIDNNFIGKLNKSCINNEKENLKKKINFNNFDSSSICESYKNNKKKKNIIFLKWL